MERPEARIWFPALSSQETFRRGKFGVRVAASAVFACAFIGLVAPGSAFAVGSISGTVTEEAAGHAPIERVRVCAFELGEEGFEGEAELGTNCELTDGNGDYSIAALPSGEYVVEFWPAFEGLNFNYEYYNDKVSWFEADPLQITTTPKTEVDAELAAGGEIEGQVVSASGGAPIREVFVCAELAESPWYIECTQTDAAGKYRLTGLPEGEYWLEFWAGETNFISEFESEVPVSVGGITHRNAALASKPKPVVVPLPPPAVTAPVVPPAPRTPLTCHKGFRKKTSKGKTHCVKIHKKKHHHHRKHPARARAQLARLR